MEILISRFLNTLCRSVTLIFDLLTLNFYDSGEQDLYTKLLKLYIRPKFLNSINCKDAERGELIKRKKVYG